MHQSSEPWLSPPEEASPKLFSERTRLSRRPQEDAEDPQPSLVSSRGSATSTGARSQRADMEREVDAARRRLAMAEKKLREANMASSTRNRSREVKRSLRDLPDAVGTPSRSVVPDGAPSIPEYGHQAESWNATVPQPSCAMSPAWETLLNKLADRRMRDAKNPRYTAQMKAIDDHFDRLLMKDRMNAMQRTEFQRHAMKQRLLQSTRVPESSHLPARSIMDEAILSDEIERIKERHRRELLQVRQQAAEQSERRRMTGDSGEWDHAEHYKWAPSTKTVYNPTTNYTILNQSQISARHCTSKELPTLSGDPQEWSDFTSNFEHSTAICGFSNEENLLRLQRSLRGKAKDAVASCLAHPSTVSEAIDIPTVMTFGAACSPSTAHYVKNSNADNFEEQHPKAVEAIQHEHYVDDMLSSVETEAEAMTPAEEVRRIHEAAGFESRNWFSHSPMVKAHLNGGDTGNKELLTSAELTVEKVLDSSTKIDCTLSSESTGQECLENVCQRISIQQPEFFGLRYVVKGTTDELRWVDLERPLSRQLEKYSANTKVLHLRVMYYVLSGVSLLHDERTRNYYFPQLKHDVVEGRISCDPRQAVILANYSRQAEYSSHQDRHTVEYLKTLLAFPHDMVRANLLEALTEQVIQQPHELHNVTQGDAESLYLSACQRLDVYGQETFSAKKENRSEVMLGISVLGIIVASDENRFYPWRDITNVVNHKRSFNIEYTVPRESAVFTVETVPTGRYIWKLCALQHRFFVSYEQNQTHASQANLNLFQNMADNLYDSRDDLLAEQPYHASAHPSPSPTGSQTPSATGIVYPNSMARWPGAHAAVSSNNMWNNAPPSAGALIETQPSGGGLMSSSIASIATGGSIGDLNANATPNMMQSSRTSLQASNLDINLNSAQQGAGYANQVNSSSWGLAPLNPAIGGSNASLINRAQSSSCLDLSNNGPTPDRARLKAMLPTYRPALDYETAVQQKYRSSSNDVRLVNGSLLHLAAPQMSLSEQQHQVAQATVAAAAAHQLDYSISGSQPDVSSYYGQQLQQQQQQQPYPDVTHHTTTHHIIGPHYSDASDYGLTHRFKMMRIVKPPPPYPANRLSSTSTPDLASHRAVLGLRSAQVSGSSPDLVSTRPAPLLNHHHPHHGLAQHHLLHHLSQSSQLCYPPHSQHHQQEQQHQLHHSQTMLPHGTYENLNFIESRPAQEVAESKMKRSCNLPTEPHSGGAWESLVCSVKRILATFNLPPHPTDELLRARLMDGELFVYSRPLTELPLDVPDEGPLTPLVPFDDPPPAAQQAWKSSHKFADLYWRRCVKEYLPTLTRRSNWHQPADPIQEGDLVLIVNPNSSRIVWPRGRVVSVSRAVDVQVQQATVNTSRGLVQRPAVKLAVRDVGGIVW